MALFPIKRDKLRRDFVKRVLKRTKALYRSKHDLLMLIDYESTVDYGIAVRGGFEDAQLERLLGLADRASAALDADFIFLDVGAYNAMYAMLATRRPRAGRVAVFEPEAVNRAQLHAQLFLNGLVRRIDVFPVAASDRTGTARLPHSETCGDGNRGGTGIDPDSARPSDMVETRKLDDLIVASDALIVAKLDVEGHESAAVAGARDLLTRNACIVQAECFEQSGDRPALRALFSELGFREIDEIGPDLYFTNIDAETLGE